MISNFQLYKKTTLKICLVKLELYSRMGARDENTNAVYHFKSDENGISLPAHVLTKRCDMKVSDYIS